MLCGMKARTQTGYNISHNENPRPRREETGEKAQEETAQLVMTMATRINADDGATRAVVDKTGNEWRDVRC